MKRVCALLLTALLLCLPLSGCGSSSNAPNGEITVLNWGEYIDESVLDDFTAQTGIEVNYKVCPDNETLYSNLQQGDSYDVIIPSDYMISRLIEEDMIEKLDFSNIPNASDVDPKFVNPPYDPANEYSVPYMWGTVGIIYNTTMIDEEITSWAALFDENYADQVLMINNSRDAIGLALKYLGYSYNTTDKAQITEAVDLLLEQKHLVQSYVMDEIFEKLEGGEAAIGVYYAGDYLTMLENNPDLVFCVPSEGSNYFVDAMCVPVGAANKEGAEQFINFMASTEVGLANCAEIGYSTPLMSVYDALDDEIRSDKVAYPSDEVLSSCEQFLNLPQEILEFYDSEWLRLKV